MRGRSEFEKRFLSEALARCGYHRARTASEIGITRQGLFKLMKKHRIEIPEAKIYRKSASRNSEDHQKTVSSM